MALTRRVARELVAEGEIVIVQKGKVVDPLNFKGPIRLRLRKQERRPSPPPTKTSSS